MIDLPLNIDYTGKVVVVTGAGGLICGAMARAFAQSGAKVAALDLNGDAVKALADELKAEGFICEGYAANVLDPAVLEQVHQQVKADLGECDILVNGAGGNNPRATTITNISTRQRKAESHSSTLMRRVLISCSSSIFKELFFPRRCSQRIW